MTDFITQVRHQQTDFIIRSIMDVDYYKLTMAYFIQKNYAGTDVKFQLINRDKTIPIAKIIPEQALREQLDHVRTLKFRRTDLYYLRGMDVYGKNMFDEEFMTFLANLQLTDYDLKKNGDQYELTFQGPWEVVTFWETIALAIISELYYRELMKGMHGTEIDIMYARATDKLYNKLVTIRDNAPGAKITDFGQRRRHSFLWQQHAVEMAKEVLGDQFVGTSNTWLAFNQDLVPIGTNAHELPMVVTALADTDDAKQQAQYDVLWQWGDLYGEGLRIVLPDTYGSSQFYNRMPLKLAEEVANNWKGQRQDSGVPEKETAMFMRWLRIAGRLSDEQISKRFSIFSDGLDVDPIVDLWNEFDGKIITPFGWGTKLTNDFEDCLPTPNPLFRPFSLVCKVVEANGQAAVKLSNNFGKATGPESEIKRYRKIFGVEGIGDQEVIV